MEEKAGVGPEEHNIEDMNLYVDALTATYFEGKDDQLPFQLSEEAIEFLPVFQGLEQFEGIYGNDIGIRIMTETFFNWLKATL